MEASPPTNLSVAVIGAGHLGRIHAKLLAVRADCELVAVCDPMQSSKDWVKANLGVPVYNSPQEIPEPLDAIVVATPTIYHHSVGLWALDQGIHALIEKPIATTVQEAKELAKLASQRDVRLQVGHVERFNPVWESLQARLEPSSISYIESRREGVYTGRSTDIGIVLDLMIHDLDLVLSVIDSPITNIRATGRCVLGQHEDLAIADLEFLNGARAHLRASRISASATRVMEVQSHREWYELDFSANCLTATRAATAVQCGDLQADLLEPEQRAKVKDELFTRWLYRTQISPTPGNAIVSEHNDFFDSIRRRQEPRVSGTSAIRSLEVACAITRQITTGRLKLHRQAA
ncbi:MAG: Gfo/Idh/MocA family protein [Planctomycetota bacterium]|jgi:predicted dehydrogenase